MKNMMYSYKYPFEENSSPTCGFQWSSLASLRKLVTLRTEIPATRKIFS
jgi:hypothetical protein